MNSDESPKGTRQHPDKTPVPKQPRIEAATADRPQLVDRLVELFVEIFPEDRRYVDYIRHSAAEAHRENHPVRIHQWLVAYGGEYVGFRLFNFLKSYNIGFSRYLGLRAAFRGRRIGRFVHDKTMAQIAQDSQAARPRGATLAQPPLAQAGVPNPSLGLCGEVDHPAAARTAAERRRREQRLAIYQRLGAILLDVDYYEPTVVQGMPAAAPEYAQSEPDRMLLYLVPHQKAFVPEEAQVAHIVKAVLIGNYRLPADSWYVQNALDSIGRGKSHE